MINRIKATYRKNGLRGFTLIELVLVIAILGILAVVALPTLFGDTLTAARSNTAAMTAAAVRAGLGIYMGNEVAAGRPKTYPTTLDAAADGSAASIANPLFLEVLEQPVTADWFSVTDTCYTYDADGDGTRDADATDTHFLYAPATGSFAEVAVADCV